MMRIHYNNFIGHKNPSPRGHEIYNFGGSFLGYHYLYILNLSDPCPSVDMNKINIAFSPYGLAPGTSAQEIMNFQISIDSSLVIITIHLLRLISAWE